MLSFKFAYVLVTYHCDEIVEINVREEGLFWLTASGDTVHGTCSELQLGSVHSCSQHDTNQEAEKVKPELD